MPDRLDPQFRDKLGNIEVPYDPADWASLQARLDAPARRRRKMLWVGLPAAALLLGTAAVFVWPDKAPHSIAATEQAGSPETLESTKHTDPAGFSSQETRSADGQLSAPIGSGSTRNDEANPAGPNASGRAGSGVAQSGSEARIGMSAGIDAGNSTVAEARTKINSSATGENGAAIRSAAIRSAFVEDAKSGASTYTTVDQKTGETPEGLSVAEMAAQAQRGAQQAAERTAEVAQRDKHFPRSIDPMAAVSDPTGPTDREWKRDPTLNRGPRLLDVALVGAVGMNAEYTAADDGFKPGQDVGIGTELWFRSGVFLSAGLSYGRYNFHQNSVACGNPISYGIKEPVHCPDALLGTRGRWEIPMQVGYGWELSRARGRFRIAAGLTAQRIQEEDYDVEFHNAQPGVLLFYEPVTISLTESAAENLSFDAYGLVESSSQYTVQNVGPSERVSNTKVSAAAELSFGYEQFLAPSFSLGVEPRFGVPFHKVPVIEDRAYYGGVSARMRWYPGLAGR